MTYIYNDSSNQLKKVQDYSFRPSGLNQPCSENTAYTYDANGNMITDENKDNANIDYNHLNLPKRIEFET
ncbi:hypothetical protein [Psychroflexus sp. MES1-P1E]|uniref:hypothetical protein n=1 Tax=Psychroflexus sp. MES1-P1E TaxID=2058320 RepID=UPI000C7B496B|nr:hypothetical protein [Psychroflexus sp. MES1-P1E]PKG42684.1 hypothetical protein CXF67_08965 [Psychroflexus sp. MES1-P1E]